MGAAFSGGSLCRIVGGVEIVVSSVIIGFGVETMRQFLSLDGHLQNQFDRVQYSGITAILQGSLTILASLMILVASRQKAEEMKYLDGSDSTVSEEGDADSTIHNPDPENVDPDTSNGVPPPIKTPVSVLTRKQVRRKLALIYKLWLAFSVLSIGLLLLVFLCSQSKGYCIQTQKDKDEYNRITDFGKNTVIIDEGKKRNVPPCYASDDSETKDLRTALANLYSYCLVNIFALVLFMFVVYYQLKRVTRRQVRKEDKQKVLPNPGKAKGLKEEIPEGQ